MSIVWKKNAYDGKRVRLTSSQKRRISFFHPEVLINEEMLVETLTAPEVVTTGGHPATRVLYRHYKNTPVTSKYLAVVLKVLNEEGFIVTSYFTEKIRRTNVIWKRTSS